MTRVTSGVKGFDELVNGGFPKHSDMVICGPPGSGKTIFGLEYIYQGAKLNEHGVYVTLEADVAKLREQAQQFSWNFKELEDQKKVVFVKVPVDTMDTDILAIISDAIQSIAAQRLVIDSLSILALNSRMYSLPIKLQFGGPVEFGPSRKEGIMAPSTETQQFIYLFLNYLSQWQVTTVCLTDADEGKTLTRDTVSEYICDGLIRLDVREFGKTVVRTIEVKKMRNTRVTPGVHALEFTPEGLEVSEFKW
jgi:circadian clock protein KaiC